MSTRLLLLAVATTAFGCASEPDDLGVCFPGEKCDSPGDQGVVYTQDRTANVLVGYNRIIDRVTSPCVTPVGSPSYIAGQSSEALDVLYLENRNVFSKETSDALGLNLDLFLFGVSGGFELLHSVSTKSTSINLLVRMAADYWVMNRRPLSLDDNAAAKLAAGVGPFASACGSHYANGVRYGGYVYALVTFDATDTTTIDSVKHSLGLDLFGIVPLTTTLEDKIKTAASVHNVAVTAHFAADGFMLDGRPASEPILSTLLGQGIGPAFFQVLDHVREQLEQSVGLDKCRDGGIGDCDGAHAPGYENNTLRNARPTGIQVGDYDKLTSGVAPGLDARFAELGQRVSGTERYLQALRDLQDRIEKVYRDEIGHFLAPPVMPFFQVAPPGHPQVSVSDLVSTARTWQNVFAPGGPARRPIQDALDACFHASDDLSDCTGGVPLENTPVSKDVNAQLASYAASGRILAVNFRSSVSGGVTYAGAQAECATGRLPSDAEARFLSPSIGDRSLLGGGGHVWVASNRCSNSHPAFAVDPVTDTAMGDCVSDGLFTSATLGVICVALGGPYPNVPPP